MTKEAAIKQFEAVIKGYQWTSIPGYENAEMKKMYATDRKDFRHILSLYRKGKYKEALEAARHLDTAARDHIPNSVWQDLTD